MEYLSDDISDLTSDPEIRKAIGEAILAYLDNLEIYTFSAIKTMSIEERDELRELVEPLVELYISEEYYIDERVVTIAQQHERERIRAERAKEKHELSTQQPKSKEGVLKHDQFFRTFFCDDCGEKLQGLFNLDDHIALMHFENYIKRYVCEICTGMWLTKHDH